MLRSFARKRCLPALVHSLVILTLLALLTTAGCGQEERGDASISHGLDLYDQREFAAAIPYLKAGLGKRPGIYDKSDVLTAIGNCYNELDQFEDSLKYHDLAIEANPANFRAYVNKGVVFRLTGDYDQAAAMYAKALEIEPEYAELHASMGSLAVFQEDYEAAVQHLERAIALDDTLPVAHSNLAMAYATVGRFDEADSELKKAVIRGYHQPEVIQQRIDQLRQLSEKP